MAEAGMSKGSRVVLAVGLLAAGAGLAAWWLLATHDDVSESAAPRDAASTEAPRLPDAITNPAPELPAPASDAPATELRATSGAPEHERVVAADFTGRVVDPSGRPVPDALVVHWPSVALRVEMKIGAGFSDPVVLARLEQTRTDTDGRFRLS